MVGELVALYLALLRDAYSRILEVKHSQALSTGRQKVSTFQDPSHRFSDGSFANWLMSHAGCHTWPTAF